MYVSLLRFLCIEMFTIMNKQNPSFAQEIFQVKTSSHSLREIKILTL